MRNRLTPVVHLEPSPDGHEALDRIISLFADGLADLLIADARREVAAELGLDEASIDREREGLDEELRDELKQLATGGV